MSLRYLFMGSPPIAATILELLCREYAPPLTVVTQLPKATGRGQKVLPTAVEVLARQHSLPVIATENVNAPETLAELKSLAPDLILVAAFGQILREDILKLPTRYCLNVHASLLPELRGAAPIQRAIWEGKKTGITIQKMARKLDTGDILLAKEIPIGAEDTSEILTQKLAMLGGECLVDAVRRVESGKEAFVSQDESKATYAAKLDRDDAPIDWGDSATEIHNQIRALQPWPVAETSLDGTRLKIFGARVVPLTPRSQPGDISTDGKENLVVTCGNGTALSLTEIQLENRKRLGVRDFLAAYRGNFPHKKLT